MLKRFQQIHTELIDVSNDDASDLPIDCTLTFANKVHKYTRQLHEIDVVTKYLQTHGLTLSEGRAALDALIECVESDKNDPQKPLYQCRLGKHYIAPDSAIVPNPHFESGVVKIQEKCFHALTDCEKVAVASLKKMSEEINVHASSDEQLSNMSMLEKIKSGK